MGRWRRVTRKYPDGIVRTYWRDSSVSLREFFGWPESPQIVDEHSEILDDWGGEDYTENESGTVTYMASSPNLAELTKRQQQIENSLKRMAISLKPKLKREPQLERGSKHELY